MFFFKKSYVLEAILYFVGLNPDSWTRMNRGSYPDPSFGSLYALIKWAKFEFVVVSRSQWEEPQFVKKTFGRNDDSVEELWHSY